jgi:hypothetical protein
MSVIRTILVSSVLMTIPMHPSPIIAGSTGVLPMPPPENVVTINSAPLFDFQGNLQGAIIPLKRAGKLFFMEGTVNDVPGNFILDTGASGLVLNKTYFRNSIVVEDEEAGGVTGSIGAIERLHVKKMVVSDLIYKSLSADVAPLGHLENRRGIKILGLFGMNLLQQTEIVLDLRHNELQVYKIDRNGNRPGKSGPVEKFDVVQKLKIINNVLFVTATMGGKELDFCLDTGAESNLIHSGIPKTAMNTLTITRRSTLRGSGSAQGEIVMGTITEFLFGNRQFGPMETAICNLNAMAGKYGYKIDGMLGYDFFIKGKMYLNLVRKEIGICFQPEEKP